MQLFPDADDAEDDEEKACDAEPNLGACFHDEYGFWLLVSEGKYTHLP